MSKQNGKIVHGQKFKNFKTRYAEEWKDATERLVKIWGDSETVIKSEIFVASPVPRCSKMLIWSQYSRIYPTAGAGLGA